MDLPTSFGYWVRRRRKALDLTQAELARRVGCAEVTIQKIEADERRPSRQIAELLAEQLAIPADERAAFLQCARAELGADRLVTPIPPIAQLVPPTPTVCPTLTTQPGLPSGMVTFLFTDIEDSTPLWEHEPEQMRLALARHDAILRMAIAKHGGHAYKVIGDSFQVAFAFPAHAVVAALAAQHTFAAQPWETSAPVRVRMGLHVGPAIAEGNDYTTTHTLNRVARIMSSGHGGQILLSVEVADVVRRDLPTDVTLRDMGKHRMKGLTQLEHLFQVAAPDLPSAFPPLKTLDLLRTNLPAQLTSFIGREQAIAEVKQSLNTSRLVTLTGPGGTGKTRLALQAAAEVLQDFAHGAYVVNLASISDAALVVATIAQTLGVTERGSRPLLESLKAELHDKDMLLLLDNFEQVLPAAPQLAELLAACPKLKMLVTSREVLHLYGEHEFGVPPLALPDRTQLPPLDRLRQYEAVALFIQRVQASQPSFQLTNATAPAVAAICYRLDGLPLAIELAAARIKLFSPQRLLAQLDQRLTLLTGGARDRPARHQTIRGAIDWSYQLLDDAEKLLFARLGVFVGGCTLGAAEAVCSADDYSPMDVVDGIAALLDKSLLQRAEGADGQSRFTMLETIHEYALERLEASGEAERLRQQHADYYLILGEAKRSKELPQSPAQLAHLDSDYDNLWSALAWSQTSAGDPEVAIRMTRVLRAFWLNRGIRREAIAALERTLNHPLGVGRTEAHAAARFDLAQFLGFTGNYAAARIQYEQVLPLAREVGDTYRYTAALQRLGWLAGEQGDSATAWARLSESLAIFRELGYAASIADTLIILAEVAILDEDPARSEALLAESRVLEQRENHDLNIIGWALNHLGHAAQLRGAYDRAAQLHHESLECFQAFGDQHRGFAWAYHSLGESALGLGRLDEAARWLAQGLTISQTLSDQASMSWCLAGLGSVAALDEEPERAARLWGAAEGLRQAISCRPAPAARATYERALAVARAQLDEATFAAAWAQGHALSLEQAVTEALNVAV